MDMTRPTANASTMICRSVEVAHSLAVVDDVNDVPLAAVYGQGDVHVVRVRVAGVAVFARERGYDVRRHLHDAVFRRHAAGEPLAGGAGEDVVVPRAAVDAQAAGVDAEDFAHVGRAVVRGGLAQGDGHLVVRKDLGHIVVEVVQVKAAHSPSQKHARDKHEHDDKEEDYKHQLRVQASVHIRLLSRRSSNPRRASS